MKFTNKIPQWAIKQALLGPLEANAQTSEDLVPNKLLQEALKKTDLSKSASQKQADFEAMSSISPSLKTLANEEINIKKANINSTEAIKNSMRNNDRESLHRSMNGTIRPIQTYDDMISEGHSRMQVRSAGRAESLFDNYDASKFDISQLSKADLLAKQQEALKKRAKKTSEEIQEEQKGRKLGEYNPLTGMHSAAFTSAKTAYHSQDDSMDVYKLFDKSILKSNNTNTNLTKEVEKNLLDKLASSIKENHGDWTEIAKQKLEKRLANASEKSKKIVDDFYNEREINQTSEAPSLESLSLALNQSEFSHRMGLKNEEYKKETIKANKQRKAAISRNLNKTSKVEKSKVYKPQQNIVESALQATAKKILSDNGVEEI